MTIGQLKELLQRYLTGKATDEDLRVIESWFRRTEEKEYRLSETKRKEVAARLLPRLRIIAYPGEHMVNSEDEQKVVNKGRVFRLSRRLQRIAAVFILLAGVAALAYHYRYPILDRIDPIAQQTVVAGPYEIRSVYLPDSSRVVLRSGSRITYPVRYRGAFRKVLMEGEAFFDVHKDPSVVFTVKSSQMDIQVLGTSFVVSDQPGAKTALVGVVSGKIAVAHEQQDMGVLTAGKELEYDPAAGKAIRSDMHNPQAIAWISKTFSFNETPLESVFAAIESKFGIRFVIRKHKPGNVKLFTGTFSEGDTLKDILLALSLSTGIRYSTIDKNAIEIHYP